MPETPIQDQILEALQTVGFVPSQVNTERNYWFVRTESGKFYEEFFFGSFIAIGWNEIKRIDPAEDEDAVITQIKTHFPDSVHRRIYNQINRFWNDMRIGDIVVIPSSASNHLAFGTITSDAHWYDEPISDDEIEDGVCPYRKRRKVNWFKAVDKHRIDPYLYQLFRSQHAISSATNYADHIDRTLNDFYIKGDDAHLILSVETTDKIAAVTLINFISGLLSRVDDFAENDIRSNQIDIKVNVQSPGIMEFISSVAAIGVLGLVIVGLFSGCAKFRKDAAGNIDSEVSTPGLPALLDKLMNCYERYQQQQRLNNMNNEEMVRTMNILKIKDPSEK